MKRLLQRIRLFNEARGWERYHDPRSLVLAICAEVGELAELFRWRRRSAQRMAVARRALIEDEVADVLILVLTFCNVLEINPEAVVLAKLKRNEDRFPPRA